VKPRVNARLFRWSLILNPLKDKVTIVHRPGRMHSNVDPLSRNPAYITLVKMTDDWEEKLWIGYQEDPYYRRIIKELMKLQEEGEAAKQRAIKRNNKKFVKAENKAKQLEDDDETMDKVNGIDEDDNDKTVDKVSRLDKEVNEDEKAMDKADMELKADDKATRKDTNSRATDSTGSTSSREPPAPQSTSVKVIPIQKVPMPIPPVNAVAPHTDSTNTHVTRDIPIVEPTSHHDGSQKSGDLSRTAISPETLAKKATSPIESSTKPSKITLVGSSNIDRSSPTEVDVDGKEKSVYRKEAEVYTNIARDDGIDEEGFDDLDLPDDMPVEIALDEALDEATEEANREGIVDPVVDETEEKNGHVPEDLDGLKENPKEEKKTITDGTFTLIGKALFFTERRKGELCLCIPESMVDDILQQNHDSIRHPGIRKTYLSIASRFYIRRLSSRVRQYVNKCITCQTSKPTNEQQMGKLFLIETDEPNHTLSLDFITGLPVSEKKFDALLTVTDKFTKAIRLISCTTTTSAEDTARLFLDYCYPIFGLPIKIISDCDARFTLRFWQTLTELLGIKLGLTAAYHPSADGQSEKTNATVETALRCFIAGDLSKYSKWTQYIPIIEHEYNSMVHMSTGFTPNELRFALAPRSISDALNPVQASTSEVAEELADDLRNRREEARDSIAAAQRKQKRYTDKYRSGKTFNVGDLVILKYKRFGPGYKPTKEHQSKIGPSGTPI